MVRLAMKLIVGGEWTAGQLSLLGAGRAALSCLHGSWQMQGTTHYVRQSTRGASTGICLPPSPPAPQWPANKSCKRWRSRRRMHTGETVSRLGSQLWGVLEVPWQCDRQLPRPCFAIFATCLHSLQSATSPAPLCAFPPQRTLRSRPTPASARPASWRPWAPPCSTCCLTASRRRRRRAGL